MRRFYDYLLMSKLPRQARFLLPSLFLAALISLSFTISSVQSTAEVNRETEKVLPRRQPVTSATPTTAEVCRETQKVLDQYDREYSELLQTNYIKANETIFRRYLSDLDKAIASGSLLNMRVLDAILSNVKVEVPKHKIGLNTLDKSAGEMTVEERSALQRPLRSALHRALEEAANTPSERLDDRIAKNQYQRDLREKRLKDLNCEQVLEDETLLKDETVESGKTPDISGTWNYGSYKYTIDQTGSTFTWSMSSFNEKATGGTITGKSVSVDVKNDNGKKSITGTVTQVDGNGRATRIEWSTGAVFTRK